MPHEQTSAYNRAPHNDAHEAFLNAEEAIYTITEMPEFANACVQAGLDPIKSSHSPDYWQLVADFAIKDMEKRRADGEDSLDLATFEITVLTPSYLFASKAIANKQFRGYKEVHALKERTSYFNGLIRASGANFSGMSASEVTKAMENVAAIAGLNDSFTSEQIRWTVRGAQHELAFGQILGRTGYQFSPATIEQDLRGADYRINIDGEMMLVDVKASLSEIEALGGEKSPMALRRSPYNEHKKPVVVMYSMIKDNELEDRFTISDEAAQSKAPVLKDFLQKAHYLSNIA